MRTGEVLTALALGVTRKISNQASSIVRIKERVGSQGAARDSLKLVGE
jgi:hypothetical protein